jgi:hypothetical protein
LKEILEIVAEVKDEPDRDKPDEAVEKRQHKLLQHVTVEYSHQSQTLNQ